MLQIRRLQGGQRMIVGNYHLCRTIPISHPFNKVRSAPPALLTSNSTRHTRDRDQEVSLCQEL